MNSRAKNFWLLIAGLLLSCALLAQADTRQLGWQEFPIAGIDNVFIPYSNPSLLGTGSANGLGIVHLADDEGFEKRYWLMFNSDFLSYSYERNHGNNYHMLATGSEAFEAHILPNLYTGMNYRWKSDAFEKGTFRSGVTYRPTNYGSIAFTWDNPMEARPFYRGGLAVRPFAFTNKVSDYRLELSADANYAKNGSEYKVLKPILGVNTQLLDGVKLGATYNMEEETALLTFSLSANKSEAGALYRSKKDDNHSYAYLHLSESNFKPFAGMVQKKWYSMSPRVSIVSYKSPKYVVGPIRMFDSKVKSIEEITAEIKKAQDDPEVSGILLVNPSFSTSLALQQELVDAFRAFKADGKKISFYFDNISNGAYVFASSIADQIYLNPNGTVDLHGIAISSPYLKDLLSTIGVDVLNFRSHKYKNAGNMFSESQMTEAEREVYDSLLQSLYDQMIAQMHVGRGDKLKQPVESIIDGGPYFLAQDALRLGLIDKIIYQDELNKTLKDDFSFTTRSKELVNYKSYDWSKPKETLIATIYASGNIVMGKGAPGQKIAHDTTVNLIRKARNNKMYKGILLRVDSGGGSAQASDIILRELELAQTENKKPIVVSMAGVAASGGYYIAAKADKIVANPATLTGSIGVVGLMFNATEMFKKVKVNWSTVKKGERADMGSLNRPWTTEEKKMLENYIEYTYEDFISKVDAGRSNLNKEEVHALAQGRVWTGEQAKENGLIDDLGGIDLAVQYMKELTGTKGAIRLVDATSTENKGLNVKIDSKSFMKVPALDALETMNAEFLQLYQMWQDYQQDKALLVSPISTSNVEF